MFKFVRAVVLACQDNWHYTAETARFAAHLSDQGFLDAVNSGHRECDAKFQLPTGAFPLVRNPLLLFSALRMRCACVSNQIRQAYYQENGIVLDECDEHPMATEVSAPSVDGHRRSSSLSSQGVNQRKCPNNKKLRQRGRAETPPSAGGHQRCDQPAPAVEQMRREAPQTQFETSKSGDTITMAARQHQTATSASCHPSSDPADDADAVHQHARPEDSAQVQQGFSAPRGLTERHVLRVEMRRMIKWWLHWIAVLIFFNLFRPQLFGCMSVSASIQKFLGFDSKYFNYAAEQPIQVVLVFLMLGQLINAAITMHIIG